MVEAKQSLKSLAPNLLNPAGETLLTWAVKNRYKKAISLILEQWPYLLSWENKKQDTAFYIAFKRRDKEIIRLLLNHAPRDEEGLIMVDNKIINYVNSEFLVEETINSGELDLLELLLSFKNIDINLPNNFRYLHRINPLKSALESSPYRTEAIELLLLRPDLEIRDVVHSLTAQLSRMQPFEKRIFVRLCFHDNLPLEMASTLLRRAIISKDKELMDALLSRRNAVSIMLALQEENQPPLSFKELKEMVDEFQKLRLNHFKECSNKTQIAIETAPETIIEGIKNIITNYQNEFFIEGVDEETASFPKPLPSLLINSDNPLRQLFGENSKLQNS